MCVCAKESERERESDTHIHTDWQREKGGRYDVCNIDCIYIFQQTVFTALFVEIFSICNIKDFLKTGKFEPVILYGSIGCLILLFY